MKPKRGSGRTGSPEGAALVAADRGVTPVCGTTSVSTGEGLLDSVGADSDVRNLLLDGPRGGGFLFANYLGVLPVILTRLATQPFADSVLMMS